MTLHFQTKALREAVAQLVPVLAGKASLPSLGAIELNVFGKHCELQASNLDVWVRVHTPMTMDGDGPDSIRVSGLMLHAALSRISDAEVQISTTKAHAILTAGSAKLSLPLITEPMAPVPEQEWGKPILIDDLQAKLSRAIPFVGKLALRPLNMAIHFGDGKIEACDGRRFIGIKDKHCEGGMIVPTELCQLVAKTEGTVTIRASKNLIEFAGEGWTITGLLLESQTGAWMNTDCMYDRKTVMTVKTSAQEAIEAVNLAAFSLPKEIDSVKWMLTADSMYFQGAGESPADTTCSAEVDGVVPYASLGVSARALTSALRAVTEGGNDEVELNFSDANSFSVSHDGTQVVCMLTRL